MTVPRARTFVLALLLAATVLHIAWSSAVAGLLAASYRHRIFDLRRWPQEPLSLAISTEMVSMFLTEVMPPSTSRGTVFFGSSVAYGFPWQEDVVVSTKYAALRPLEHVVNVGVIGADLAFLESAVLCGAVNAGLRADVVIVELPVLNSVNNLLRNAAFESTRPRCDQTIGPVGYWSFAVRHPLGAGWLPFIWDNKAFPKTDREVTLANPFAGYFATLEDFRRIEPVFRQQILQVLEHARAVGKHVYVLPSPVFLTGVREIGFEMNSVEAQLASALATCRATIGVQCLDPQPFYTQRDWYYNMTHFNQRGHHALAEWLDAQIDRSHE